jgi:hypothetical protein
VIASKNSQRVPLQSRVAHFVEGTLRLRRFRKPDQGGADFVMPSPSAVSALLDLEAAFGKEANHRTAPGCRSVSDEYFCYWTPRKKPEGFAVTVALEPMGLPSCNLPFSLTLAELKWIAAAIRTASDEETRRS